MNIQDYADMTISEAAALSVEHKVDRTNAHAYYLGALDCLLALYSKKPAAEEMAGDVAGLGILLSALKKDYPTIENSNVESILEADRDDIAVALSDYTQDLKEHLQRLQAPTEH